MILLSIALLFLTFAALGTVAAFGHLVDNAPFMGGVSKTCFTVAAVLLTVTFYIEPNALNMPTVEERISEIQLESPTIVQDFGQEEAPVQIIEQSDSVIVTVLPPADAVTQLTANAVTNPDTTAPTAKVNQLVMAGTLTMCNESNTQGEIRLCTAPVRKA